MGVSAQPNAPGIIALGADGVALLIPQPQVEQAQLLLVGDLGQANVADLLVIYNNSNLN